MRSLILVLLLITSTANAGGYIHSDFQSYLDEYLNLKGRKLSYNINIMYAVGSIELDMLQEVDLARCYRNINGFRYILVSEQMWSVLESDSKYDATRKAIIFHELGHCDLDLEHTEKGLMKPTTDMTYTPSKLTEEMAKVLRTAGIK
jgi:hypothetical protein